MSCVERGVTNAGDKDKYQGMTYCVCGGGRGGMNGDDMEEELRCRRI